MNVSNADSRIARIPVWLLAVALLVATLLVYAPTLRNGFVDFDDPGYILANPHVRSGLTLDTVGWAFTTFAQGNWHPVTWLSHILDCQFFGINAAGHHATSIVIHALNALLLFLLLQAATRAPWRSLIVAALFALHPINVETVSWAAERKSLLSMLFSLLAVWAYGRWLRGGGVARYLVIVVFFALALMSKPMAVTLPLLLLLLDYWPLERYQPSSGAAGEPISALILEKLPLFAMSAASGVVTIVAQRRGGAVSDTIHLPLWARLENTIVALAGYLRHVVVLNDFRYFYPHRGVNIPAGQFWISLTIVTVAAGLVVLARRREVTVGAIFFVVTLLPVLGILQVGLQSMADRYAYLPFIGIFVALVWTAAGFVSRLPSAVPSVAAVVVIAVLALFTVSTERYWHDSIALFQRASDVTNPPNLYIETNLAAALLDAGRTTDALRHFRRAEAAAPRVFATHYNIAYLLAGQGDVNGAIAELQLAVACDTTAANRARALKMLSILNSK